MKYFNEDYKTKLYKTIEELEDNSLVEIVVIAKQHSNSYKDISLWFSVILMFTTFTFLMFAPFDVDAFLIFIITILSFFSAFLIVSFIPVIKKIFIKKARMLKTVEITARAIFQKGGLRFTDQKIGILIYVSDFEKTVCVLPDRGAETAIPEEEWKIIRDGFDKIYTKSNPANALLEHLLSLKTVFYQYIPPIENDINELPDDLEVTL